RLPPEQLPQAFDAFVSDLAMAFPAPGAASR
ncbi:MAG: hypothetical protein JWP22_749, partial [Ramlibacter sp.]|nr:hypothetical protein [Ramlibacter sp.]